MWIITQNGFISAVEYRPTKDKTSQLPDEFKTPEERLAEAQERAKKQKKAIPMELPFETRAERRKRERLTKDGFILARARVKDDLEQLRPFFEGLKIIEDGGADYQWRAVIPRKAYQRWAAYQAGAIDYASHFKEVAAERSPKDPERYHAMMTCWGALNRMGGATKKQWGYGNSGVKILGGGTKGSPFGHNTPGKRGNVRGTGSATKTDPFYGWDDWYNRQREEEAAIYDAEVVEKPTDTVIGMARELTRTPVDKIFMDEFTPAEACDLWVEALESMQGETDQSMTFEQVIDVLEELNAQAKAADAITASAKFTAAIAQLTKENTKAPKAQEEEVKS